MERIDDVLRVVLDDVGVGEDGDPVAVASFRRLDAVHREASGEAGDSAEDRLERLGEMMRDVVLEDWRSRERSARFLSGAGGGRRETHLGSS